LQNNISFKNNKTILLNLLFSKYPGHMLCKQAVAAAIASTKFQMDGFPYCPLFSYNFALEEV
jgi:hypothetical protein